MIEEVQNKVLASQNIINFEKPNIKMVNDGETSPLFTDLIEESKLCHEYFEYDSEYNFKDDFFKDDTCLDNIFSDRFT